MSKKSEDYTSAKLHVRVRKLVFDTPRQRLTALMAAHPAENHKVLRTPAVTCTLGILAKSNVQRPVMLTLYRPVQTDLLTDFRKFFR